MKKKKYVKLIEVITKNDFESVKLLIDSGANINFQMKEKPRSEFLASEYANPQILELYLNKNIYLLMNSEDVVSLIKSASIGNNVENINYLVKNLGIDVDTKDTNTMLHYAVGHGSVEAADELIKLGADIDNTNANFKTSLHYIIENNSDRLIESVNLLLSKKANPNIKLPIILTKVVEQNIPYVFKNVSFLNKILDRNLKTEPIPPPTNIHIKFNITNLYTTLTKNK